MERAARARRVRNARPLRFAHDDVRPAMSASVVELVDMSCGDRCVRGCLEIARIQKSERKHGGLNTAGHPERLSSPSKFFQRPIENA